MTKYVRLDWMRNTEGETDRYMVYRSESLPVDRNSVKVCEVEQPLDINPIEIKEEVNISPDGFYHLSHGALIRSSLVVKAGELPIKEERIRVDETKGIFEVDEEEGDLSVSYQFDGVTMLDKEGEGKRFAPPAIDNNSIKPPENIRLKTDMELGILTIEFDEPISEGKKMFYAVEALGSGNSRSNLSEPIAVVLRETLVSSSLQSSLDGKVWTDEATLTKNSWSKKVATEPPNPVESLKIETIGSAVNLSWILPEKGVAIGTTPSYRFSSVFSNGEQSSFSRPVGPIAISSAPQKIVIKRFQTAGEPPAGGNPVNDNIAELTYEAGKTSYIDLVGPGTYRYMIYVVDKAGNTSIATTATIDTKGEIDL